MPPVQANSVLYILFRVFKARETGRLNRIEQKAAIRKVTPFLIQALLLLSAVLLTSPLDSSLVSRFF
jgi:hypothetical protein